MLHAGVTLASGSGPESTDFSVDINDIISVDYTPGLWASENIYRLYDESGTLVIEMASVESAGPDDLGDPAVPSGIQACPSCPAPIELTATPGVLDAEIAWTETGDATTWNIEYGFTGFTPGEGTIVTGVTSPYTITGLSSSMNYECYVQADCGDDDMSMWSGPVSFTTLLENDECMNALDLPLDGSILNTSNLNSSASGETPIPVDICGDIADAQDVWYSVTATELSDITITTSAFEGSTLEDTILVVYSGECGSLEMIGCNDDFESAYSSLTVFGVEEGVTLYVRVFSWGSLIYDAFGISANAVPSIGVNEGHISNFSMYPNPVDNTLNLKASVSLDSIVIYDMLGRVIISSTPFTMETTIDTSTLESGAYIVKVQSKDNVDSYNLMKR